MDYTEKELLRVAKRLNNNKRQYLLVNPLQAKHIPVAPSEAFEMMNCLGEMVSKKYNKSRLVIAFAETATAIGAVVAKTISDDCFYIHTTREDLINANGYIYFKEEHSHAVEQKLVSDELNYFFNQTDTVIFVDDEFSTGKTLINIVNQLKTHYPVLHNKKIVAASIINRLSDENMMHWNEEKIESVSLLKLPNTNYTQLINSLDVKEATKIKTSNSPGNKFKSIFAFGIPDPRLGVNIKKYYDACLGQISLFKNGCDFNNKDILVLGTEECMLPALLFAKAVEETESIKNIRCHATTRSPIGINPKQGYPIQNGFKIHSFYNDNRDTYIYNIMEYDIVFVISDTQTHYGNALNDLSVLLSKKDCICRVCIVGENYV